MNKVLLAMALALASAIAYALPSAIDTELDNQSTVISEHQKYLADNQADIDDDAIYYASDQYKAAKHANQFLRRAYED